jgi:hypothetical protein
MERERSRAMSKEETLRLVSAALDQVANGEIKVSVEAGKPIWVSTTEKKRVG